MLTPLQIGRLNSMCSQGGLPSLTTTGMYTREMTSPVLPYATIGVTSNPCKVLLPLCTSATTRVRLIRLRVAKAVNRVTPSKRYVLQLPLSPRLAECLHVMVLALGQPSATMSSSLHHLQKVLLLLLSSNRYSSRTLISTSMCPSSTASFRVIESTTTIMHVLFFKMLCRPILSSHVCQAWMLASPRRGCVSQGYPLAIMNGCSSLCR
mmetsp:Transcript_101653/g.163900  ORF Transcript_101653/g.163900 Transcript_101653/m.163900 type:complete len:208 (+) Transcript_101653:47-670(+)